MSKVSISLCKNTIGMKVLELTSAKEDGGKNILLYSPKNARAVANKMLSLADKMEAHNDKHFPTVTISKPKEKRRTKNGQVRTYFICKKCKHVLTYDYTPYSLSAALVLGSCKCGSVCFNDYNDYHERFREVGYKEAMEQKRVNKVRALSKADLKAFPYASAGRE